ncbi:MAG: hypothetical protein MJ215_02015 [Spirochaetia bacterium]|nr:hypothetical protein [Spirochaetia bacterium]
MKKLIVFDMDGVLVDVSCSYRDVTRKAAYIFLKDCHGGELLPEPMFGFDELAEVKQRGGLNNDWDMTYHVISMLLTMADTDSAERENWDVTGLASFLKDTPRPLAALLKKGKLSDAAVRYYSGDVGSGNVIKQIFQEIYLGQELFRKTYSIDASYFKCPGYILKEKLFVNADILKALAEDNILAVATGRPRDEALYPLEKNGLDMFSCIMSLDECAEAERLELERTGKKVSFAKPSPFMLDTLAEKYPGLEYIYAGDVGDDMIAAKSSRYGYKAVGIVYSAPDRNISRDSLLKCGADILAEDPEELLDLR